MNKKEKKCEHGFARGSGGSYCDCHSKMNKQNKLIESKIEEFEKKFVQNHNPAAHIDLWDGEVGDCVDFVEQALTEIVTQSREEGRKELFTEKELFYLTLALETTLDTFKFMRGFTEETDREKFMKKLIEKIKSLK